VWSEPCGTWLACEACQFSVIPAAVAAAYDRGAGGVQRNAATDQERDLADVVLCARKDELLRRITASGLPSGSELAAGLASKIRDARSGHRLDQLAGLLDQALPGAAEAARSAAGDVIDAEIVADDDGPVYCYDPTGRLVAAVWDGSAWVPAAPQRAAAAPRSAPQPLTWDGALARLGLRYDLLASGNGCKVRGPDGICGAEAVHSIGGGRWACFSHHQALAEVITLARRTA
jgi:hypothetical protein